MTKKAIAALIAALLLTGCAKKNYNLECDAEDYLERDTDCGYFDKTERWHYFDWTKPGETTYSPDNWEPPKGVKIKIKHSKR